MTGRFTGKVALVTGGSRGIGAATARAFANEGADIAITYLTTADKAEALVAELEGKGVRAASFGSDQSVTGEAERLLQAVIKRFGRIDILVNNAAMFAGSALDSFDAAELERLYATNQQGVIALIRAAARHLAPGGRIVSVSSNVAERAGYVGFPDYIATKAAITGYSRAAARELGPRGITVNILQSGPTVTEMNPDTTELAARLKRDSALGRYGQPDEIAAGILFLASPEASYITGAVLAVDGGINA